jgi:hypothetical protein
MSQRARRQQELAGMGIEGSLAGKRVVISLDGGRIRFRKRKRGKKTQKGRSRYHTDWREPKLLVIYVVNDKGRISQEFAPVIDGTRQGPDEIFRLLEFYLSQSGITEAKKILFIADGAKWIWLRVGPLLQRLGLEGRCRELVDFYHVVEHVNTLAALKTSWRSPARKRWVSRQRRRLRRGEVKAFITEIERFCQGKRGRGWARERDYLLRNARAGRLDCAKARRAKLPMGSDTMESAIRRVVNLRLKGVSIFWTEEHAEQMLLLRTYYKSKRWEVLENKAFATPLTTAAQLLQNRNAPEEVQRGPLKYWAEDNPPFGQAWNTGENFGDRVSCSMWTAKLQGIGLATTFEVPYANAADLPVNADNARAFGCDLARAVRQYLVR